MTEPSVPVEILWTGGWDSTYRVLDLVLVQGRPVRPHYIEAPVREGSRHEIAAMDAIREGIETRGAGDLLAPLERTVEDDIPPDTEAHDQVLALQERGTLGWQYDYLSRYARHALGGERLLELSVHLDDKAEVFLRPHVVPDGDGYVLRDDAAGPVKLFDPFSFPLLDLTKTEMAADATRSGFADLMDRTWFCHSPRGDHPCGVCNPCRYTHAEGMGHRLPLSAHVRRRYRDVREAVGGVVRPLREAVRSA